MGGTVLLTEQSLTNHPDDAENCETKNSQVYKKYLNIIRIQLWDVPTQSYETGCSVIWYIQTFVLGNCLPPTPG